MKLTSLALTAVAAGLSVLAWTRSATAACTVDTDCPGTTCGSQVCDWTQTPHACVAAGQHPAGQDGWCTQSGDCKCASLGASCNITYCSFTTAPAAGSGSSSGTSAASYGGGGGGGGCTMAQSASPGTPWGLSFAAFGACAVVVRRRRRRSSLYGNPGVAPCVGQ
jgi:hypothetical protein